MKKLMLLLLVCSLGCSSVEDRQQEINYEYVNDFRAYLQEVFNEPVRGNKSYFVIPLTSCEQCVDSALIKLCDYKLNWVVIFTGQTEDPARLNYIGRIKENYLCYDDAANQIAEFAVSIAIPTLLKANHSGELMSKYEFHYGSWVDFNPQ